MRIYFFYEPAWDVGSQGHISIYTPFGEAIDNFCTHVGIREEDWEFWWWPNTTLPVEVQKDMTPHQFTLTDNDSVDIYSVPVLATN